jgi:hypothetical protein
MPIHVPILEKNNLLNLKNYPLSFKHVIKNSVWGLIGHVSMPILKIIIGS